MMDLSLGGTPRNGFVHRGHLTLWICSSVACHVVDLSIGVTPSIDLFIGDLEIRDIETWGFGDPEIRGSRDPNIRRSIDPEIRRSVDPEIRRSEDLEIRRSGDPEIWRSGDPEIRKSGDPDLETSRTNGKSESRGGLKKHLQKVPQEVRLDTFSMDRGGGALPRRTEYIFQVF